MKPLLPSRLSLPTPFAAMAGSRAIASPAIPEGDTRSTVFLAGSIGMGEACAGQQHAPAARRMR